MAELFPMMTAAEFDVLVADIRENGQMEPIVIDPAGLLIDGRNRAKACEQLDITPIRKTYAGLDVLQYVVSHNLVRRHLTDSQRALIAANLSARTRGQNEQFDHMRELPPSAAEAADLLAVSPANVNRAKRIIREGTDNLRSLVTDGMAPIATAVRVAAELTDDEQDEYVDKVRAGADPVKAAPRRRHKPAPPPERSEWHHNRRHINPERIIEQTISTLDGIADGLALIEDISSLDAEKRLVWCEAFRLPLAAINRFKKELSS